MWVNSWWECSMALQFHSFLLARMGGGGGNSLWALVWLTILLFSLPWTILVVMGMTVGPGVWDLGFIDGINNKKQIQFLTFLIGGVQVENGTQLGPTILIHKWKLWQWHIWWKDFFVDKLLLGKMVPSLVLCHSWMVFQYMAPGISASCLFLRKAK